VIAPAALRAAEYCSGDGYSFARNCSFSSMEQCKAISGTYAACLRDPFLKDDSRDDQPQLGYLFALPSDRAPIASGAAVKPEELNVSKSSPLVPSKLTSMRDAANSLTG
jgi:hypothetical protein